MSEINDTNALRILSPKVKKIALENIRKNESIIFCLRCNGDQSLIALDERLIIIKPGALAGEMFGARVATFLYKDITGIEVNHGPFHGVIEICTPSYQGTKSKDYWNGNKDSDPWKVSNCLPIDTNDLKMFNPYIAKLREKIQKSKESDTNANANNINTVFSEEITKLLELKKSGVLTEEEFQQAKRKLLGL